MIALLATLLLSQPATDCSQGWTVACTVTLGPGEHPHVFALYAADGSSPIKLWLNARKEWRLEGTGIQFPLVQAATYKLVAWHDRETGKCGMKVNSGAVHEGQAKYVQPVKLALGDWPGWGLRFSGRIDNTQAWGRMLTSDEIGAIK